MADPGVRSEGGAMTRIVNYISSNKIEALLWFTRLFTIYSTINFILFSGNSPAVFQKTLLSNGASSALRLHQRLPNFQFSREYFSLLLLEDSAHYLFYSLIFLTLHPVAIVLIPLFLYALLHATAYTKNILDQVSPNSAMILRNLIGKLDSRQVSILRFIASCEIFLAPVIIMMIFAGASSFLLPFMYYRFLSFRYSSRRNPYHKQLFYELRVMTESLCGKPQCPEFVRSVCFKIISIINRLAPVQLAQ